VLKGRAQSNIHLAYNRLRTQMLKRLEANNWKTVAVMGPTRGTGSTVTAINLAISIAREFSYNVLLVELDLIEPSFQRILGFDQRLGLADHLLHDVPIADILLNPGIEQLDLIPAGSPVTNSSELISSPQMARFVKEVKEGGGYRVVLFDLPPVLGADDAMVFARFADCALLVVEEGETRIREVRRALDYLEPTELLGVVLNRSVHVESDR
jgi:capsular exopolysaccharide synthesis family protein